MRLINKIMEKNQSEDPYLMEAFQDMQKTGDKEAFINALQNSADLFLREIKHSNHNVDFLDSATYQHYAATCANMIQDVNNGKRIDREQLSNLITASKRLGSKDVAKVRRNEDLSKNPILYEAIVNEISTGEFARNEIMRAIREGSIKCSITENGLRFESKAFENGTIECSFNGNIKDPAFYADQLAYESSIGKNPIDVKMLTELNMAHYKQHQKQAKMEIER